MSKQLAETILHQLKCGSTEGKFQTNGAHAMMCWGFQQPMIVKADKQSLGGLVFKVEGCHHKGLVKVTLAFNDTYSLEFMTFEHVLVKSISGVYCDQLTSVVDSFVESNSMGDHKVA